MNVRRARPPTPHPACFRNSASGIADLESPGNWTPPASTWSSEAIPAYARSSRCGSRPAEIFLLERTPGLLMSPPLYHQQPDVVGLLCGACAEPPHGLHLMKPVTAGHHRFEDIGLPLILVLLLRPAFIVIRALGRTGRRRTMARSPRRTSPRPARHYHRFVIGHRDVCDGDRSWCGLCLGARGPVHAAIPAHPGRKHDVKRQVISEPISSLLCAASHLARGLNF